MYILALRTDKPEAELYLLDMGGRLRADRHWPASRELANQLPGAIEQFLHKAKTTFGELSAVIVFQGPGSFTGLRIAVTVANALAYSQAIPVVASQGDDWRQTGLQELLSAEPGKFVLPEYGALPHITQPKK